MQSPALAEMAQKSLVEGLLHSLRNVFVIDAGLATAARIIEP